MFLGSSASIKKRAVIEIFRPRFRKTETGATNSDTEVESSNGEVEVSIHGGVVDECCKKPCTFATLVSYCANAQLTGNIEISGLLSSEHEEESNEADGNLSEFRVEQVNVFLLSILLKMHFINYIFKLSLNNKKYQIRF